MKRMKLLPLCIAFTLLLCSCGNTNDTENTNTENNSNSTGNSNSITELTLTDDDMFTNRDMDTTYSETESIMIQLNGSSISCDSDAVTISGTTVTITDEGTYILSGTLDNGMILVNAEDTDKPQLVFNNVTIHSEENAPLCILEADKVFVTLAENSTNTLSNGGIFTALEDNNVDGTIFSKQDLTFNGNGTLTITSPAGHGIVAKDDLVFTSGTYNITSASHGLDINDSLRVKNTDISIAAGKDGAHVENSDDSELGYIYISSGSFDIDAEGDGLSAGAYIQIENGSFDILAGGGYENSSQHSSSNWGSFGGGMGGNMPGGRGGRTSTDSYDPNSKSNADSTTSSDSTLETESSSMKGIKAVNTIQIANGTFNINSADDAIHSNTSAYINGGNFTINSGDDALHAENALTVTNGTITINNSYEGLEALDVTVSGGDISIQSTDDGINAAGGTDSSAATGGRDAMFGGNQKGGMHGGMSANSNGSIIITGGTIFMYAKGDGLDANGYIEITGGTTIVTGPTSGDTAILDYDTTATIANGTFIGVGSTMMAQTFSDGTQGTIAVQASANGGTEIRIEDTDGNEIISYTPETSFQCVIISTPNLTKGDSYTIYVGSQSGTFEAQ